MLFEQRYVRQSQIDIGGHMYSDALGGFVTLNGVATHDSTAGVHTLTPNAEWQLGNVMSHQRIDLGQDFHLFLPGILGSERLWC